MSHFEDRLVETLQPVRYFFLAQTVEYGLRSGVLDALAAAAGQPLRPLAESLGLDADRLGGLLRYWWAEGLVTEPDSAPALTLRGLEILEFRSWYELFIGGYGRTLHELPTVMRDATAYAGRDGAMVGVGSCGMSRSVDVPLVRQLVEHVAEPDPTLIDLGCGDGTLLLDLCDDGRRGIGIDPVEASVAAAQARAAAVGRADDVRFAVGTAEDYIFTQDGTVPCFIAAFSLQEALEQRGRDAVTSMVARLVGHPGAYLAVVEVDHRPTDPVVTDKLGIAYYNPYYLIHHITEQRLETTEFWRELFAEAGARVVVELTTDPKVDSTGLELGFLLCSAGASQPPGSAG